VRDVEQITQPELAFLRQLWEAYPAALGFDLDRAGDVDGIAVLLVDEGYVERVECTARHVANWETLTLDQTNVKKLAAYRLADHWAKQFWQINARQASHN
jgi:hypothetical protein